jgi:hypothetical protein
MRTVHFPDDSQGRGPAVHHVVLLNQPTHTACEYPSEGLLEGDGGLPPCSNCLYTVRDGEAWLASIHVHSD